MGYLLYTVLEALTGITLVPMLIFDKTHRRLARSCLITVRGEDRLPSPLQLLMLTLCFSSAQVLFIWLQPMQKIVVVKLLEADFQV